MAMFIRAAFLAAILAGACCGQIHGATNHLAIYRLELSDKEFYELSRQPKVDPKTVTPGAKPILSDPDFVSFNLPAQAFTITVEAARRLAKEFGDYPDASFPDGQSRYCLSAGQFFLFCAEGERIYVGVFWSGTLSRMYFVPRISADVMCWPAEQTNTVSFRILSSDRGEGYLKPEVRNDARITSAVRALGIGFVGDVSRP